MKIKAKFTLIIVLLITPLLSFGELLLAGNLDNPKLARGWKIGEITPSLASFATLARPFKTNDQLYKLESIFLGIEHKYGTGELQVSIREDGINPDTYGGYVNNGYHFATSGPSGISNAFIPSSTITLAPNTTYWIYVSASQNPERTQYSWIVNATSDFSSDVVGAELPSINSRTGSFHNDNMPVAVYVSPIPEPSSTSFIVSSVGIIFWIRRRYR